MNSIRSIDNRLFLGAVLSILMFGATLILSESTHLQAADFTVQDGITLSNQNVTLSTGDTGTILFGGTITDPDDAIAASGNVTIDNAGSVISTGGFGDDGIIHTGGMLSLLNRATGIITGGDDGVESNVLSLDNLGTITGSDDAVRATTITSLINSGTITGGDFGIIATTITELNNSGTIVSTSEDGIQATTITSFMNSGTITAAKSGVFNFGAIESFVNSGTINADAGVFSLGAITSLTNTGTINAGSFGLRVFNTLIYFNNSGTIIAGDDGVTANAITSLKNTGTITGVDTGVTTISLTSLTNSGKITGGNFSIQETGAVDTLLTLLPGSDLFGAINLGGGTNTLVIGNGLNINHLFATVPDIINSNGAQIFISGNRVVVVDTSSTFDQQDEQLFDLTSGIWGTVFNNIGDGSNPAATFANGSIPQYSLGAVSPGEIAGDNSTTHMWASVFGNHRMMDGGSGVRQNLGGLIAGLDGRYNSNIRLGAFFGSSKTDIDSIGDQETEVENIFGGLYSSYKTNSLTIDLGVTGGTTEHESARQVDNNQINGLQTVSSSFDGTFIAPELSISSQLNLRGAILQPTLSVGYAGMFLDGYTETGGTAPLTVGDRDLHLLHARFELAAIITSKGADSISFTFSPYVGIEGRSLVGGETVNVTLLGQNLSFTPGGSNDIASAFAGMRLSVLQTENFGIFAGFEGSLDTDENSTLTGNFGLKWQF